MEKSKLMGRLKQSTGDLPGPVTSWSYLVPAISPVAAWNKMLQNIWIHVSCDQQDSFLDYSSDLNLPHSPRGRIVVERGCQPGWVI